MIPAPFTLVRATSVAETLDALSDPEARPLAGGQSLIPLLKLRLTRPSLLVDISEVTELRSSDSNALGALMTWRDLARRDRRGAVAALADAAASIGDRQVRNRGTLGGGVAHADPAADIAAAVVAGDASLVLRSATGERTVPATQFYLGPFTTATGPGELLARLILPDGCRASAYASVPDPASGYPLAGAAVFLADGGCRIGVTGVAATAFRLPTVEAALDRGEPWAGAVDDDLRDVDLLEDVRVPADYRVHLVSVVIGRALEQARAREAAS